ncbi:type II toxin-antitoxin system HicB family antitoxin [Ligilactobacillus ruminis]|uniref:type II toxin-antitoxin system HicB family antitoxin n=1 Tax=Ligilactobacillus ruminis TaxID=1623 RepID=UPI003F98D046
MKEKVIVYPAVLDNSENSDDVYTVTFPDVPGAISEGKGLAQAMLNGSEALGLMLYDVDEMPEASNIDEVRAKYPEAEVTLIFTDLEDAKNLQN